jgi:hypothetical protein
MATASRAAMMERRLGPCSSQGTAAEVCARSSRMHVLIITFTLNGLADADYRQHARALAPQFTQIPGLVSKAWLADAASNTYGGVYFFEDAASRQRYLESEIVAGLQANPAFAGLSIRAFGTVEAATAMTGGPLVETLLPA